MLNALTKRCYCMPFSRTADRPSLGVICGDRLTLRVDGGNSPAHAALMERAMAKRGLPPTDLIAVTHSHWDHSYGLSAAACPVIACRKTQAQLLRMAEWQWTPEAMERRLQTGEDIRFCHDFILEEYPDPAAIRVRTADVVFDGRLSVDLGGVCAELLCLTNSHAEDCVVVHVPEEGVVYLGDICYEDLHHEPPCIHRRRFEALLDSLSTLDFTLAVPGHQMPMSKAELLDDMQKTLDECECVLDD